MRFGAEACNTARLQHAFAAWSSVRTRLGCGVGVVWLRCGRGLVEVWAWLGCGEGVVWLRRGRVLVETWEWLGCGVGVVWL